MNFRLKVLNLTGEFFSEWSNSFQKASQQIPIKMYGRIFDSNAKLIIVDLEKKPC